MKISMNLYLIWLITYLLAGLLFMALNLLEFFLGLLKGEFKLFVDFNFNLAMELLN